MPAETAVREKRPVAAPPHGADGARAGTALLERYPPAGTAPPPDGAGGEWGGSEEERRAQAAVVGAWALVAAVTMLFVGFTATYLVRRSGPGWFDGPMPGLLYLNTGVILASSAVLERARRQGRRGNGAALARGLAVTVGLGSAFVLGQAGAWWQMVRQGLTLSSGPHPSFFYLLSGMHALHVAAGMGWLATAWARARRAPGYGAVRASIDSAAVFWHFVGVLWVYLWALLFWM